MSFSFETFAWAVSDCAFSTPDRLRIPPFVPRRRRRRRPASGHAGSHPGQRHRDENHVQWYHLRLRLLHAGRRRKAELELVEKEDGGAQVLELRIII